MDGQINGLEGKNTSAILFSNKISKMSSNSHPSWFMLESPVTRLYLHEYCIILVLIINIHVQSAFISCPCTYPPTPGTYRWMVVVIMNNSEPFILITNITEEFANESFVSGNWCVFDLDPHLPARENGTEQQPQVPGRHIINVTTNNIIKRNTWRV